MPPDNMEKLAQAIERLGEAGWLAPADQVKYEGAKLGRLFFEMASQLMWNAKDLSAHLATFNGFDPMINHDNDTSN